MHLPRRPFRWDLLKPLIDRLVQQGKATPSALTDTLDVAQLYSKSYGRDALLSHVRRELTGKGAKPTPLHSALARLHAPVIFTTNYDFLMERAIEAEEGVPPDVIVDDRHIGLIDEARRTTVVKMHGCLSLPKSIILARDDYKTYAERHRAMVAYLQSLLATRTVLFAGFSLTDPNYKVIHSAIQFALGEYRRTAYALLYRPNRKRRPARIQILAFNPSPSPRPPRFRASCAVSQLQPPKRTPLRAQSSDLVTPFHHRFWLIASKALYLVFVPPCTRFWTRPACKALHVSGTRWTILA